jgi:hypothetical protein
MPFIVFVMLVIALPLTIKFAMMPTHPIRGTYTVTDHPCSAHSGKTGCYWYGTFISDDGKTTLEYVEIHGAVDREQVGTSVPAMDVRGWVYTSAGPQIWKYAAIEILIALGALILWPFARQTSVRADPYAPLLGPIARNRSYRHMSQEQQWTADQRRSHKLGKRARR